MASAKKYFYDIEDTSQYETLKESAVASEYGTLNSDMRLQVKMPSNIVNILDQTFPASSRSKIITQAVIELLLSKYRVDDPQLEHWQKDEQYDLDRMWSYLDERESNES